MWFLFKINNFLAQAQQMPSATPLAVPTELPTSVPTPLPVMPPIPAPPAQSFLQFLLLMVYFLICAALVTLVLLQTSKSEGLSGTLGGSTQSIFRGKKSFEDKLGQITMYVAIAFIFSSILIAFFAF